jgi:microcystin-dependent protein/uncharacterized protein YjbI with pentapeptide repeats
MGNILALSTDDESGAKVGTTLSNDSPDYIVKNDEVLNTYVTGTDLSDLKNTISVQNASTTTALNTLKSYADSTYLTSTDAAGTYLKSTDAAGTYLKSKDASGTYLKSTDAAGTYLKSTDAAGTYLKSTDAAGTYLKSTDAAGTYLKSTEAAGTYLKSTDAAGTYLKSKDATAYLKSSDAAGTYLKSTEAAGTYLKSTDAVGTYLKSTDAAGTYLKSTDAAGTYATQSVVSGIQSDLKSNYATLSSLSNYIKATDATSTIQSNVNTYLNTVGNIYKCTTSTTDKTTTCTFPSNSAIDASTSTLKASSVCVGASCATSDNPGFVPAGSITAYYGSTAPSGWLLCDGKTYTVGTTYGNLYRVLNGSAGTATSTFTVPDLRGKFLLGASGSTYTVGSTGGESTKTLTTNELPAHIHSVTDSGHTHDLMSGTTSYNSLKMDITNAGKGDDRTNLIRTSTGSDFAWPSVQSAKTNITIASTGGGKPFSILNPYAAVNYIIKY